jgi:predicted RNA binding protein YcfA (HicA-like mRNA interferase family)
MGNKLTPNKDLAQLIKKAKKQGWIVEATRGNHLRWISPNGDVITSAKTPSDRMSITCTRLDLKRRGYKE